MLSGFSVKKVLSHSTESFRRGTFLGLRKIWYRSISCIRGGCYLEYPSKKFCLTAPNHSVEEVFCVSERFGFRKNIMPKKGKSRFSTEIMLSHSTEELRRGALLCCVSERFLIGKKFMDERWGQGVGVSRISVESFLSHSAKTFRRGTLLCFREFPVSKILCIKRAYHDFLLNNFCLTVLKFFENELFYVSDCFSYRKVLCIKGLSHDFLTKQFCLTVPNYFLVEPFSVSESFWYRKMLRI